MADPKTTDEAPPSRPSKLRPILMVGGLLAVEAIVIIGAMVLVSGPPSVEASGALEPVELSEDEKIVEQLVVEGRFPNSRRGVTYLYDAEVYVQVRRRHVAQVRAELEQFTNEIKADIGAIWRTSDPHHFEEPRLENLTRKVYAMLAERFGDDPESGEPIVEKVVIVMGTGLRVEG